MKKTGWQSDESTYVLVRQSDNRYLFYCGGKWSDRISEATLFLEDVNDEVHAEVYSKYHGKNNEIVRCMPKTTFTKD